MNRTRCPPAANRWQHTPNGNWSGWESLGGSSTSGPAATLNAPGGLVVFVRGTDNAIWHKWQNRMNGDWSGWESLGGTFTSGPAAVSTKPVQEPFDFVGIATLPPETHPVLIVDANTVLPRAIAPQNDCRSNAEGFRWRRSLGFWVAITTTLLAIGAVYGGFHYASDVLAGVVVGVATWSGARWIEGTLRFAQDKRGVRR